MFCPPPHTPVVEKSWLRHCLALAKELTMWLLSHPSARVRQQKSDTYFLKGSVVEYPNLSFEIAPLYRFWENRDVISHVKSMGKIACVGTNSEFKLKICHCCELSSYCYLNDYQWGLRYTLELWRQSRLTSHFRNQIKRFGVCLEASCSWLSK